MKWIKVSEGMPDFSHIEKRTQFLVKGFFQLGDSVGDVHYTVTRLCSYFNDDTVLFEEQSNFNTLEWCEITE